MSTKTGIEWTDATWNPIRGCSRVSEGCRNCYAESVAYRFGGPGMPYEGLTQVVGEAKLGSDRIRNARWNGNIKFVEEHLADPLKWKAPRRIFVNSMSDLFHKNVADEMRDKIFAVMALCPRHTFQILTKRPERMLEYLKTPHRMDSVDDELPPGTPKMTVWPLPNVHLGVSVENQATADERIPLLLQTPAAVRFISAEPLLGEVILRWPFLATLPKLDWVICGGESGPGARPMHPDWARGLRDQCVAANVPFFFKQWGEWISLCDYEPVKLGVNTDRYEHEFAWRSGLKNSDELPISCYRVGKKAAGSLLDGVEWKQFPGVTG
jgi:protein gp37